MRLKSFSSSCLAPSLLRPVVLISYRLAALVRGCECQATFALAVQDRFASHMLKKIVLFCLPGICSALRVFSNTLASDIPRRTTCQLDGTFVDRLSRNSETSMP